jgi:succinyl-CoA synthetase beta subunit
MKLHEYQAKQLLARFGVGVPEGRPCTTLEEALAAYDAFAAGGASAVAVKAQIHAGGRGKGGGVKLAKSREEARAAAQQILGMQLVTHQTGPKGQKVRRILVERGSAIQKEYYLGCVVDRDNRSPVLIASSEGGMEIEEVAARHPEKILRAAFSPRAGLRAEAAAKLAKGIGIPAAQAAAAVSLLQALAKAFVELDCSMAEINPLVTTADGKLLALDAKIVLDDNAAFRHADLVSLRDLDEEDALEIEASKANLNYIKLDGTIGCMVNGAGLAMATMDVIKLYGAEPANFLDVGGGATKEQVMAAFRILLADPNTKAVLVNIFGGIMKCDTIAEGIVGAAKELHFELPLVVRLEGTNVEQGRAILKSSGLKITPATSLDDAAQKACAAAGKR